MSDEKVAGPGQTRADGKDAATQRAEHVEALKRERNGYEVRGMVDRVKQVDAELARFKSAPKGRKARATDEA